MRKSTFSIPAKSSISLASLVARKEQNLRPSTAALAAGFIAQDDDAIHESDVVAVLVESADAEKVGNVLGNLRAGERLEKLADGFLSAQVGVETARQLIEEPLVTRIQTKKRSRLHLEAVGPDIGLVSSTGSKRVVQEDGTGVLIGIVDSGFDLSHPMFRDANGQLRVEGLLDQDGGNRSYTRAQLERGWSQGKRGPGADGNGHGTHVASISGGSSFLNLYEGVAPGARFLLVKTDFINTDEAVSWIFTKAGARPCVINMSLGHHYGAHDGTDVEERFHRTVAGPGKILVISAGNERTDNIHIGGRFFAGQSEQVEFDLLRQQGSPPFVALTLWHHQTDKFSVELVTPTGHVLPSPAMNTTDNYQSSMLDIEFAANPYAWSESVQIQIKLGFKSENVRDSDLRGWKIRLTCVKPSVGRMDGWFNNSGFAIFREHHLVERNRTVGLSATGDACLAVASHVSRATWSGDLGRSTDTQAVIGRSSSFSSLGPTRDGRWKPDISAPGQYITAALADGSELGELDERALANQRLLTIEGTSMAAPIITGIVALLLQKNKGLDVENVRQILREAARHDIHTGPAAWDPAYGFGKVDVASAIARA